MAPAREEEHSRSFDPGLSTGYLRRGARDHDLPVEIGAAPFDPGPGTGYDERRARRDAKRRRRLEGQRQDRLAKLEEEIKRREAAERDAREREERERREQAEREERERQERIERELAERERVAREARERIEWEERERRLAAERERERQERARQELREKRRRELEARKERERALRDRRRRQQEERELRLRRQRERRRRTKARPAARRPAKKPGLAWPTARAAGALAAVSAVAGVFGTAIGLPVPVLSEPGSPIAASLTGNPLLDAGTSPGLTKGPYFPVVTDNPDYGEADAKFGASRSGHIHRGQDVFARPGTPLVAVRDGIVLDGAGGKNFYAYGGGNSLAIYSPVDDRSYVYLHMLRPPLVRAGETVQAGQQVGQVGCTGSCFGPHLHFEIRLGRVGYGVERKAIDPLPLLQQWPAAPSP